MNREPDKKQSKSESGCSALENENSFLRHVLDSLTAVGILVVSARNREGSPILYANKFWLDRNNTTWEQAVGKDAAVIAAIPKSDLPGLYAVLDGVMASGEPFYMDTPMTLQNGDILWGLMEISRFELPDGEKCFLMCTTDITRRREAEESLLVAKNALEGVNRIKDKFVTLVSHDLRSPLSSLSLGLDFVTSRWGGNLDSMARDALVKCQNSVDGLLRMTGSLLDIERLQTGTLKPNKVFINLKELVSQVYFRLASLALEKKVTLTNDIPAGRKVFADPVLFQQVIQNLVANAIKYCRDGGNIAISIAQDSPNTIVVKDNGIGVAPDILPDIFKMEVRTTTLGTNGEKGMGLGLPLCYNIMKEHGGDLRVESTPGEGSAFYVELPAFKAIALVVDDQRVVREEVAMHLARMRVEVVEAENGQDGYEKAISLTPQLIITDITMPVMDGLTMLDKLKSQPAAQHIPVVVMTSSEDTVELRRDVFSRGAADFICKPLVPGDFVPRIQRFVES
ncbi:MAG: hybrid sensor histidine kinase/response regulator [Nitrospinae bacterium]|nr:hybrid sensor histidine kinase/response regulator [Nitrospinota bacterium]